MNEARDLRKRRDALQIQLAAVRAQLDRNSQTNSFARSRERVGVSDYTTSDKKDFADQEVAGAQVMIQLRNEIALIDKQLRDQGGVGGKARRLFGAGRKP